MCAKTLWDWLALQIKPHCLEVKCLKFPPVAIPPGQKRSTVPTIHWGVTGFIGAVPNAVIVVTEPADSSHPLSLPALWHSVQVREAVGSRRLETQTSIWGHDKEIQTRADRSQTSSSQSTRSSPQRFSLGESQDMSHYGGKLGSAVAEWLASQYVPFLDGLCGFSTNHFPANYSRSDFGHTIWRPGKVSEVSS